MKAKCAICGREIVGKPAKKLMIGPNGNRAYDVCPKHVEQEDGPADVLGRAEKTGKSHHLNVSRKTIKRLAQHIEEMA